MSLLPSNSRVARLSGFALVSTLSLSMGLSACSKADTGPLGGSSFTTSTDSGAGTDESTTAGGEEDSSTSSEDTSSSDDTTDTSSSTDTTDTTGSTDSTDSGDGDSSSSTDGGDGDSGSTSSTSGDGDGDTSTTSGDGDGTDTSTTTGDGDGDTSTTGDGDGDSGGTTGDGDGYAYNGVFWYLADDFGDTCNATCASHGGFAPSALDYSGDVVSAMMNPEITLGGTDFEPMECLATNNLRWGRNAASSPTGEENNGTCRYYCPCNQ